MKSLVSFGIIYVEKNTEILLHKSNYKKDCITFKNDPRTEEEIMTEKGYSRIWDCGLKVYGIK